MKNCCDCQHHHKFVDDNVDIYYFCDNFKREECPDNPCCSRFKPSLRSKRKDFSTEGVPRGCEG